MKTKANKGDSKLVEVVEKARGKRSYRKYAQAAGISSSALLRIVQGDYVPSPVTIRKLTSDQARPEGGVTFEEMMAAAGHQESDVSWMVERHVAETTPNESRHSMLQRMRRYEELLFEKMCVSLLRKGYSIKEQEGWKWADYSISVQQGRIKTWSFVAKYVDDQTARTSFSNRLIMILGQLMLQAPDPEQKTTIIVNSEDFFTRLKGFAGKIPYRGDLSVALYDEKKGAFTEEKYLSHYYEGETEEFFLI